MNLGRAIKLCRSQREITQFELANASGLSVSYLSLLEKNKRDPSLSTVQKIADGLKIPSSILFFLAAERTELVGLDDELAKNLALSALTLIHEKGKE